MNAEDRRSRARNARWQWQPSVYDVQAGTCLIIANIWMAAERRTPAVVWMVAFFVVLAIKARRRPPGGDT